jgi:indolepyruvate ferredoxin oxidoreductase alpha subunit
LAALGDEAVAHAAVDSGARGMFAYPGTPATEILERARRLAPGAPGERVAEWAANEKVAYELALGVSYTGYRALVAMKHVGLNVAMDAFVNSAVTGVQGALVLAVADDPGMHSSQNEQDSRYLADFAHLPCLEPCSVQEAYDFTCRAFDLSEQLKLPVMVRLVTRLAHCRAGLERREAVRPPTVGMPPGADRRDWVLLPSIARAQYLRLRGKIDDLYRETDKYNLILLGTRKVGVALSGMGRAHFDQLCTEEPVLREFARLDVGAYPLSQRLIDVFLSQCDDVFVFEEDYPYLEDKLRSSARGTTVHGRRDRVIPVAGELSTRLIRSSLGLPEKPSREEASFPLPARPPRLCEGCGHADAFEALGAALGEMKLDGQRVFGDIGCYTLGALPPHELLHTCVEMGASVGMTLGAALAGLTPAIGVIGDSTFIHSGLPAMASFARARVNANLIIMDNRVVAMTGQQETVLPAPLEEILAGLGMDGGRVTVLTPLPKHQRQNVKALRRAFENADRSDVIIFRRECVQARKKRRSRKAAP